MRRTHRLLLGVVVVLATAALIATCRRDDPGRGAAEGHEASGDGLADAVPRRHPAPAGEEPSPLDAADTVPAADHGVVGRVVVLGQPREPVNGWVLLTERVPPFDAALVRIANGAFRGPAARSGTWRAWVTADGREMRECGTWPRDIAGAGPVEIAVGSKEPWDLHVEEAGQVTVAVDEGGLSGFGGEALRLGPSDDALATKVDVAVESDGMLRVAGAPTLGAGVVWLRRGRSAWRAVFSPAVESTIRFEAGGDVRVEVVRGSVDLGDVTLWMTRGGEDLRRVPLSPDDAGSVLCEGVPVGRWTVAAAVATAPRGCVRSWDDLHVLARADVDIDAGGASVVRLELDARRSPDRPPVQIELLAGSDWPSVASLDLTLMPVGASRSGVRELWELPLERDPQTGASRCQAELPPCPDGTYELLVKPFGYLQTIRIGPGTTTLRVEVPAPHRVRLELPGTSQGTELGTLVVTGRHADSKASSRFLSTPRGIDSDPYDLSLREWVGRAFEPLRTETAQGVVDLVTAGQPLRFSACLWSDDGSRWDWTDDPNDASPPPTAHRDRVQLTPVVSVGTSVSVDGRPLPNGCPLLMEFRHPEFGTRVAYVGGGCGLAAGDWQVVVRPPIGWTVRAPERVRVVAGEPITLEIEFVRPE